MAVDPLHTLDILPALVSTLDASLRYEVMNAQHRVWLGIDPTVAIGRTLWEVIGDSLRPVLEPAVARALAGETVDTELEMPPSIQPRWVRLSITPERGADGTAERIHFLVTDVTRERALARQLERSEAKFNAAFAAAGIGKALVDDDGVIREANPAFATMLGLAAAELTGRHFADITYPDDLAADLDQFEALKCGEIDSYRMEKRYVAADGAIVDALLTVGVVRASGTAPQFYVAQILDVRDRKQAEQSERERSTQLGLALEMVDGGVWQYRLATRDVCLSSRLADRLGLSHSWLPIDVLLRRIHPEDRAAMSASLPAWGEAAEHSVDTLCRVRDRTCAWRWMRWRHQLVRDPHGRPSTILGIALDVTAEQQRAAELTQAALTDTLTGLFNRRGFDLTVERFLDSPQADGLALLLVDLDRFKPINDQYGHDMGDRVLREIGRRLRVAVRTRDVVSRLGGDEFAVLLPGTDTASAESAARRIVAALGEPYRDGGLEVQTSASVGLALAQPGDDPRGLVKRADEALYAVKRNGRGAWRLAA